MRRPALFLLALLSLGPALPARAEDEPAPAWNRFEQVFLTEAQALDLALPGAQSRVPHAVALDDALVARLQRALGRKLAPSFAYVEGRAAGRTTGYAVILEEKGKHEPITFVAALGPDLGVREVAVMIYRERRGEAVRRKRFLNQFVGKTAADPLALNRDLTSLTGATVSCWSIAAGVKRAVVTMAALRQEGRL